MRHVDSVIKLMHNFCHFMLRLCHICQFPVFQNLNMVLGRDLIVQAKQHVALLVYNVLFAQA
jgi:hypothetical protein